MFLLPGRKNFLRKWRRIQRKLPQSGVKTTQIRHFDRSSGVSIGRGDLFFFSMKFESSEI